MALAPVLIVGLFIYLRDRYEREPLSLLLWALLAGGLTTLPVYFIEVFLQGLYHSPDGVAQGAYDAFVVASTTEEVFKYLAFLFVVWSNQNFNEKFDGIVYAVFVSLGFAGVENVLYVLDGGQETAILRAFTAVPGHALFGVAMGYHLGLARFLPEERTAQLFKALLVPILLHGIYDFMLMAGEEWLLLLFIPYIILLWVLGFRRMRAHDRRSPFKPVE